ncbi:SDR family oxidoreductase [Sphingomonadaceae bacterium OTU29MARTA1]|nr:SDR family oxidoreductase [Sphingomonadaceae bacterium OTU29MARTA1]
MGGRLEGKRVLVTAAGQGIGHAIVAAFEREGATVFALDRDAALLGDAAHPIVLDLLDHAAIDRLPERTGAIDVLVNAAGIVHAGSALDCTFDDWDTSFALNVTAMFRTIRAYLPAMIAQRQGSIVNIASVASSIIGVPDRFAYGTTKAAVIGMTKAVAADFVGDGVRCNAICPGTVETPSLLARVRERADRDGSSVAEAHAAFAARQPVGRLGRVDEIAAMAVHLASDESAFTTGTTAVIDGGWSLF